MDNIIISNQIGIDDGDILQSSPTIITKTHTHTFDSIVGMEYIMGQKADTGHTHKLSELTNVSADLEVFLTSTGILVTKSEFNTVINSKASSVHGHAISDIIGLGTELNGIYKKPFSGIPISDLSADLYNSIGTIDATAAIVSKVRSDLDTLTQNLNITGGNISYGYMKPNSGIPLSDLSSELILAIDKANLTTPKFLAIDTTLAAKANSIHNHTITDVNGLDTILSTIYSKPSTGIPVADMEHSVSVAMDNANVAFSSISDIRTSIVNLTESKAEKSHTHIIGEINQLDLILAAKAPIGHQHDITDILNLSTTISALYTKPSTGIPRSDLADNVFDSILIDNNLFGKISTIETGLLTKANITHVHSISDVTDLRTELDNRYIKPTDGITSVDLHQSLQDKISGVDIINIQTANMQLAIDEHTLQLATKYSKPSTGIPEQDLSTSIRDVLAIANTLNSTTIPDIQTSVSLKASSIHTHALATPTTDGFLSASDKMKLDSITSGAGNTIASITGLQPALDEKAALIHAHAAATTTTDGFISSTDKTKLDSIATNATSNSTDAVLKDRANHTGVQAIATVTGLQTALDSKAANTSVTTTVNGLMIATDKAKLDGLNSITLLDRANHTGVQAIATVTGLQTALDGKAALSHSHAVASTTSDGLLSSSDKTKLDSISSGAGTTIASITGLQAALDGKSSTAVVSTTVNGLMAATDKVKLDGLNSITLLDRENHTGIQAISTITGLQTALDGKAALSHSHAVATTTTDGFISSTDKTKLDGIASNATSNSTDAVLKDRANHTGVQTIATVTGLQTALDSKAANTVVTTAVNGLMISTDKAKLDGIATNATSNSTDAVLKDRANHTGVQSISTITGLQTALDGKAANIAVTTTVSGLMISSDKIKLDGIATNATANSTDAILKDRANHTGVQAISTVTGLQTSLDGKYVKPTTGIPATDFDSTTQTSVGLANTAIQPSSIVGIGIDKAVRLGVLNFSTTNTFGRQLISTNIPANSSQMVLLEFAGIAYNMVTAYSFVLSFYTYNNPTIPNGTIVYPVWNPIYGMQPQTINAAYVNGLLVLEIVWPQPIYYNRFTIDARCSSSGHNDSHYKGWTCVNDVTLAPTEVSYMSFIQKHTPLAKQDPIAWTPSANATQYLTSNGMLTFQATSNEKIEMKYRGGDGVIRGTYFNIASNSDTTNHMHGLLFNGSGTTKTTAGWSGLTYDIDAPPGFDGSFKYIGAGLTTIHDNYIKVDPGAVYEISAYVKSLTNAAVSAGIVCYDGDYNLISSQNCKYVTGSVTTLSSPLAVGNTTVNITSSSNWNNTAGQTLAIYDYRSSTGKLYNISSEPYTRFVNTSVTWANSGIANNVVTLTAPFPSSLGNPLDANGTWPTGTILANALTGDNYVYRLLSNYAAAPTWSRHSRLIGGLTDTTGGDDGSCFRPGTQYIRVFLRLCVGGTSTSSVNVAGIYFNRTSLPRSAVI